MPTDLRGRPIVITGASSGIGRATALACARAGMPVVLGSRRVDRLEALAREVEALGGQAAFARCDVSLDGECERLVALCAERFGPVYAAFANAGFGFEAGVLDTDLKRWREILEVNLFGTLRVVRAAGQTMAREGRGHLLITSSCLARLPTPFYAAYTATKAAQHHVGRAMGVELRAAGVRVSTIYPVGTETEFFDAAHARSGGARRPAKFRRQRPDRVAEAIVRCLRRPRPEVWTSWGARTAIGLAEMFPRLTDAMVRRAME